MTRTAKGCGGTVLFPELFKVRWADQTGNKGIYYREGGGLLICTRKIAFFDEQQKYIYKLWTRQCTLMQFSVCCIT